MQRKMAQKGVTKYSDINLEYQLRKGSMTIRQDVEFYTALLNK
ncbi:hypothetical protein [Shewanella maritima]